MPTATIENVTSVIATDLDTSSGGPIDDSLDYAETWNNNRNDPANQTTAQTREIERWKAILNIKQYKERSVSEHSSGDSSGVFEGDEIQRAKAELSAALSDAGEDPLKSSSIITDSNRYVTST